MFMYQSGARTDHVFLLMYMCCTVYGNGRSVQIIQGNGRQHYLCAVQSTTPVQRLYTTLPFTSYRHIVDHAGTAAL